MFTVTLIVCSVPDLAEVVRLVRVRVADRGLDPVHAPYMVAIVLPRFDAPDELGACHLPSALHVSEPLVPPGLTLACYLHLPWRFEALLYLERIADLHLKLRTATRKPLRLSYARNKLWRLAMDGAPETRDSLRDAAERHLLDLFRERIGELPLPYFTTVHSERKLHSLLPSLLPLEPDSDEA